MKLTQSGEHSTTRESELPFDPSQKGFWELFRIVVNSDVNEQAGGLRLPISSGCVRRLAKNA
jgi:hypothetical protein